MVLAVYCERLLLSSDVASAIQLLDAIELSVSVVFTLSGRSTRATHVGTWMADSDSTKAMLPAVPLT
jgi:hypothetical protein